MVKRGQTSTEYLMTYGWAILVILLLVAAFTYLFVVRTGNVLPDTCFMPAGISCLGSKISESSGIIIVIENNKKRPVQSFNLTAVACGNEVSSINTSHLKDGERFTFNFTCASAFLVEGETFQSDIGIRYMTGVGTSRIRHTEEGVLVGAIQP